MDDNKLEMLSKELKAFLAKYKTSNILGHLSFLMTCITNGAEPQLKRLSSPMRQLYYTAGLMLSIVEDGANEIQLSDEDIEYIVDKLIEIDSEHAKLFFPDNEEYVTEEWKKKVEICMPTFLSYFNLGPLNYEEQVIAEIKGVFSNMDDVLLSKFNCVTNDFLCFYENLDAWCQYNFRSLSQTGNTPLRTNWLDYTDIKIGVAEEVPDFIKEIGMQRSPMHTLVADPGIKNRFKASDLVVNGLSLEKVNTILDHLTMVRDNTDFLYYTSLNPLLNKPIVNIGDGLYQVFEEKRVLHAIKNLLENACKENESSKSRMSHHKGDFLENRIVQLFLKLFKNDTEVYRGYYVDGCEQDIMIIWHDVIIVIESKSYANKEPFRNVEKAFTRIKQDFDRSVGYAYKQTKRVEEKIKEGKPFEIKDKHGVVLRTIDPKEFDANDFYIIVNQESFGQIQSDLSLFLQIPEDYNYPWAIRFDDLEVFMLTMIARKKKPQDFIDFLILREYLHGHILCNDEGEICGGFLSGRITQSMAESDEQIITHPSLANIFDDQYRRGMGFENEKYLKV